jgi:arylsulfatase A-like enzyme
MNTPRHGVYTVGESTRGKSKTRKIIPVPNREYLTEDVVLLPELFKKNGYITANFGKWHVSEKPLTQGVDFNVAGGINGNPGKNGYFSPYEVPHISNGPEGEYLTDRLTTEAITFIEQNRDTSFFVYLPLYAVHTPLLPNPDLYESKYRNADKYLRNSQRKYAAMVETLDQNIGRLIDYIDEMGLAKNTIIILTSDNGGIASISPQTPARAGKGSYFQGGLRVPLMIRWQGVTTPQNNDQLTVNLDFFATFCEMFNLDIDQPKDGISLLSIILGERQLVQQNRFLYFHFPIYLQSYDGARDEARDPLFRTRPGAVIISQDWSLHEYFEDNEKLLFNLTEDVGEQKDVAKTYPEVVEQLYDRLSEWREAIGAPVPKALNEDYDEFFSDRQ